MGKNKDTTYEKLKDNPDVLSIYVPNPIPAEKWRQFYVPEFRKGKKVLPVSIRIGTTWMTFDQAYMRLKDTLDKKCIDELVIFLCSDTYLEVFDDGKNDYYQYLDLFKVPTGSGIWQEGVANKQNLILHYGSSLPSCSKVISIDEFKTKIEDKNII